MNSKVIEFMKKHLHAFSATTQSMRPNFGPKTHPCLLDYRTEMKHSYTNVCKRTAFKNKNNTVYLVNYTGWISLYITMTTVCIWCNAMCVGFFSWKTFQNSSESLVTEGSSADVQVAIVFGLMGRALGCLPPEKWKNQSPLRPSVSCKVKVEQLLAFGCDQHVVKALKL